MSDETFRKVVEDAYVVGLNDRIEKLEAEVAALRGEVDRLKALWQCGCTWLADPHNEPAPPQDECHLHCGIRFRAEQAEAAVLSAADPDVVDKCPFCWLELLEVDGDTEHLAGCIVARIRARQAGGGG